VTDERAGVLTVRDLRAVDRHPRRSAELPPVVFAHHIVDAHVAGLDQTTHRGPGTDATASEEIIEWFWTWHGSDAPAAHREAIRSH
jgi:hypothetical protein